MKLLEEPVNECRTIVGMLLKQHEIIVATTTGLPIVGRGRQALTTTGGMTPMAASSTVPKHDASRKSWIGKTGVLTLAGFGIRVRMHRGHLEIEDGVGSQRRKIRLARVGHGLKRLVLVGSDVCGQCDKPVTRRKCPCGSSKRKYRGLMVHDMRRSGAKALRRAGVPESVIMEIGGWKTESVFRRYAIVSATDRRDAMDKL